MDRNTKIRNSFLNSDASPTDFETYVVSAEAVRILTQYFFSLLSSEVKLSGDISHLDLVNPEYSVLFSFHQYIATLLMNETGSGRLSLIWAAYDSFDSWVMIARSTGQIQKVRRSLLLVEMLVLASA